MDVLAPLLKSIIGDQPANGWTALITFVICTAYVVAQKIRAQHHLDMAAQDAPFPGERPPIKPPSATDLPLVLAVIFAVGALWRVSEAVSHERIRASIVRAESGDSKPKPAPSGRKCTSDADCSKGESCERGVCTAAARKPRADGLDYTPDERPLGLPVYVVLGR